MTRLDRYRVDDVWSDLPAEILSREEAARSLRGYLAEGVEVDVQHLGTERSVRLRPRIDPRRAERVLDELAGRAATRGPAASWEDLLAIASDGRTLVRDVRQGVRALVSLPGDPDEVELLVRAIADGLYEGIRGAVVPDQFRDRAEWIAYYGGWALGRAWAGHRVDHAALVGRAA